jgi:hypothetical protein
LSKAQWGGAIVSLALILGLIVWGYRLMVRDVSGVPVIRAMTEDARLVPEDPGGQLAMHQGLAVNSVTADGSTAAPADRLVLAPRTMELSDEDQPMGSTLSIPESYAPENVYTQTAEAAVLTPQDQDVEAATVTSSAQTSEAQPTETDEGPVEDDLEENTADLSLQSAVLTASPRPRLRPQRAASAQATSAANPQTGANLDGVAGDILSALGAEGEVDASQIPVGTRLVQFGAFQNAQIARQEWDRLTQKFEEFMDDKVRVIETAESGGKTFYRLRAHGFTDAADSNRFCAALTARNAACVPVRQR